MFQVGSHGRDAEDETVLHHCKGVLKSQVIDSLRTRLSDQAGFMDKENKPSPAAKDLARMVVSSKMLYETIFTRVVASSPKYQTIHWLEISNDGMEGRGEFRLKKESVVQH